MCLRMMKLVFELHHVIQRCDQSELWKVKLVFGLLYESPECDQKEFQSGRASTWATL